MKLGWRILQFDQVTSTNRLAMEFDDSKPLNGTVLCARSQTAGRGRQGRNWLSKSGKGIYASLILTEGIDTLPAQLLSMTTALAIYDALSPFFTDNPDAVDIKWPNDLLIYGKKISGILGEMKTGRNGIERIVIGFSINVYHNKEDFGPELEQSATSLALAGIPETELDILSLLKKILDHLDRYSHELQEKGPTGVIERITRHSSIVSGKRLKIQTDDGQVITGVSCGINADGSLQFRQDSGIEMALYAGEVHLLKNS